MIHCFEPQKECWKYLDNKVKSNNYNEAFINKFAVGDKEIEKAVFIHMIVQVDNLLCIKLIQIVLIPSINKIVLHMKMWQTMGIN